MRKLGTAVVMAVLIAFGAAALASGDSAGKPSKHRSSAKVITVLGTVAQISVLDLGETGFSLGDQVVFSDDLQRGGADAGTDGGACTVVRVADAVAQSGTLQCLVTFSLERGQITTQALDTLTNGQFAGTQVAAITGGTGRFRDATGEAAVEFLGNEQVKVTFTIRR
jgi:hypothetical protein